MIKTSKVRKITRESRRLPCLEEEHPSSEKTQKSQKTTTKGFHSGGSGGGGSGGGGGGGERCADRVNSLLAALGETDGLDAGTSLFTLLVPATTLGGCLGTA